MAFAKRDMQSSASIAVNYLEPSSSFGLNGLAISRVNPYRVAKPSAASSGNATSVSSVCG